MTKLIHLLLCAELNLSVVTYIQKTESGAEVKYSAGGGRPPKKWHEGFYE
jgi:hypothetical protein